MTKKSNLGRMISLFLALTMVFSVVAVVPAAADAFVEVEPRAASVLPGPWVSDFFYVIDYANESVLFGDRFYALTRPNVTGRDTVTTVLATPSALRNPLEDTVRRSQISFIFNRRADRIRVDRGNWQMTMSGDVDVSRQLRRGTFMGVRMRLPNGSFELLAVIELDARPGHREIRAHRRDIFGADRATGTGSLSITSGAGFQNPEPVGHPDTGAGRGEYLEIRIGNDRRSPFGNGPYVLADRLAPGETAWFNHDWIPRGTRGTFRIAPNNAEVNFVFCSSTFRTMSVQEVLDRQLHGLITADAEFLCSYTWGPVVVTADLLEGNFGSQLVGFRINNQPNAPNANRMTVGTRTVNRVPSTAVINGTNARQHVLLYRCDDYDYTRITRWAALSSRITLNNFIDLFDDRAHFDSFNGTFEIRVLRDGRIPSAPAFLNLTAEDINLAGVGATVADVTVANYAGASTTTRAAMAAAGVNVVISTRGVATEGLVRTGGNQTVATSWFRHDDGPAGSVALPDGLEARVTAFTNTSITVTITGTATLEDNGPGPFAGPMHIVIPAANLRDRATPLTVTPNPDARFNIAFATAD